MEACQVHYRYIAWGFISNVEVRIGGRKVGRRWGKIRKRHVEQGIWVQSDGLEWVGPKFWRAGLKK